MFCGPCLLPSLCRPVALAFCPPPRPNREPPPQALAPIIPRCFPAERLPGNAPLSAIDSHIAEEDMLFRSFLPCFNDFEPYTGRLAHSISRYDEGFSGDWSVDDSTVRKKENNNTSKKPLSYEDVAAWSKSFELLMSSHDGRWHLTEFLKCEFSDENILFWQACEELKRETNNEKIEEKARIIYEDFISILSPKEVSLDSRVRENVNLSMANPTAHVFDEAQVQIYTLMQRDSYPRYLNSAAYRNFLEQLAR